MYVGDQLIRGAHGLAGEIGYLSASSRSGEYVTLAEALVRQWFGRSDAPAIDVAAVVDAIGAAEAGDPAAIGVVRELGASIGHAIVATSAIVDPELVLLGGPIGSQPALLELARATVTRLSPGRVRIAAGSAGGSASLRRALHLALDHGRQRMLTSRTDAP